MSWLWTLIIGLIVGAIAKWVMPGRQGGGIIVTIILGIVGAFVATWIGQAVGWYRVGEGAGFIASIIGALIILWIYGMITRKREA
ncbi:MAG: GlsB/YeaQ/YmgE family stress response membrane protein [Burkholderiaceae bacterium]|nr:GlsB/YeaQ/YmgE family stress response membrane protein [Burkholderiaceae bacterium]MCD6672031.1 GlsB/YeaQ/YmgE family stress response membrane protein [Burkholderiaceae bacterium]